MKLEVFEYLIAIEKYGSLSRAAEHLFVSQPNLTGMIRRLEDELGYAVLDRSHRGVRFTERGRQVLLSAHNIVREHRKITGIVEERRSLSLKLSIGHFGDILDELLPRLARLDELDLTVVNLPVMEALEAVYRQTLDLAYMIVPTTMDHSIRDYAAGHGLRAFFFPERLCQITLRKDHPLLKNGFSKEGLWQYPFVDYTDQYPDAYGEYRQFINPGKLIRVDQAGLREQVLRKTDAFAIGIDRGQTGGGLVRVPTPELRMHLAELRRETDAENPLYNSLRERMESRVAGG